MPPKRNFHLTPEQLAVIDDAVNHSSQPEVKHRAQALLLLHQGASMMDTAMAFHVSTGTLLRWYHAWQREGIAGLSNRAGRSRSGDVHYRQTLVAALEQQPCDLGIPSEGWTVNLLRDYMQQTVGVLVSETSMRALLHQLGYRYDTEVTRLPILQRTPRTRQEMAEWLEEAAALLPGMFGDKTSWRRSDPEG
jgi:transposase